MIQHQLVRLALRNIINANILNVMEHPEKSLIGVGNAEPTSRLLSNKTSIEYADAAMFDPYPFGSEFNDDDLFITGYWIFTEEEMKDKNEEDYPWDQPFFKIDINYKGAQFSGNLEEILPKLINEIDMEDES